jgi:glyoxylase-like metal-dependent hydrolase (beta-lactamase superfamily II)
MAASVTIRMYNQNNLGDCFLLKFHDGTKSSFFLIDFGSYTSGNEEREKEIAQSIRDTVNGKPVTIVLTHQHKDHLTGFITAAEIMKKLQVSELWLSYLDEPNGKEAKAMRKATEKFWKKNTDIKKKAKKKFKDEPLVGEMLKAKDAFDLFAEGQTGGKAISNLLEWCKEDIKFLVPGEHFDLPGLPADSVRVYVLGPPTDPAFLRKLNPGKHEAVHGLNAMMELMNLDISINLMDEALQGISDNETSEQAKNFPFNKKFSYSIHDTEKFFILKNK